MTRKIDINAVKHELKVCSNNDFEILNRVVKKCAVAGGRAV
jgi:hypothetical protein